MKIILNDDNRSYNITVQILDNRIQLTHKGDKRVGIFSNIYFRDIIGTRKFKNENSTTIVINYCPFIEGTKSRQFKRIFLEYVSEKICQDISATDQPQDMEESWLVMDHEKCTEWYEAIQDKISDKKKNYLIVVNPHSGVNSSYSVFSYMVRPLIESTGSHYDIIPIQHASELNNIFDKTDLSKYDTVVVVGGDGTLNSCISNLIELKSNLPVGIVPTGSGNAMAKTIADYHGEDLSLIGSIYHIIKGDSHPINTTKCILKDSDESIYSILGQAWGLSSDVDIESEYMRCLGSFRFTLETIKKLFYFRHYKGKIEYLPITEKDSLSEMTWDNPINEHWETIDDKFVLVWGCQAPFMAHDMKVVPQSKLGDNTIYLIMIREGVTRLDIINIFMKVSDGSHITSPYVEVVPVSAYRLYPDDVREGNITVDGESVEYRPMQVSISKGAHMTY